MSDEVHDGATAEAEDVETRWRALAALREEAVHMVRVRITRPDDAEDHVHEAMLRLAQRPIAVSEPTQLRNLVVRAACCIAIDRHRHAGRQQRLAGRLRLAGEATSPEEIVADRSEARWLAASVGSLGAMEQDALVHAMAGRRPGEIATLLGVDYKSAENALGRARRKLRLLAASAAVGIAGLVRRVRLDEHPAALTASTLAAALLFLNAGSPRLVPAQHGPAAPVRLEPALVVPVSTQLSHAAAPAAPREQAAAAAIPTSRPAAGHTSTPTPPSLPSPTLPPPPWQYCPGVELVGRPGVYFAPGTPEAFVINCALEQRYCYC